MKFGGTSLRDATAIRSVTKLVRDRRQLSPVVVVSAHAGITNKLVALADAAAKTTVDLETMLGEIEAQHRSILTDLALDASLLDSLFQDLRDLCRGIRLVGECSPRSRDAILSFGERCSARAVAAAFDADGIEATAVDAFDLGVRSDSRFGNALLQVDDGRIASAIAKLRGVPVVTGFIAKDANGNITTIGRNGSDLSAAYLGNAIDADEIQIWTDVDGVLTAGPRVVPTARPIAEMSYDEAAELANHGGKVLHPASLAPAIAKSIPVRVLNTHRPDSPGTLIVE
ncbi:MAG TPA: aspartate kinase [Planctomycetota bacterium]|nr:aspartate kinase [Planctomycetota bacterium]